MSNTSKWLIINTVFTSVLILGLWVNPLFFKVYSFILCFSTILSMLGFLLITNSKHFEEVRISKRKLGRMCTPWVQIPFDASVSILLFVTNHWFLAILYVWSLLYEFWYYLPEETPKEVTNG